MITSTANRQLRQLSLLMSKARERKKEGVFVVEGLRMFCEAPKERVRAVYVSEHFLERAEHRALLQEYSYETVSDAAFLSVSDTQSPQGVLAVVEMPSYELSALLREPAHLLLLESIQDPGNLGTMIRTAEGAGVTGVILNRTTADLFAPKTIRSTMGSIYRMPFLVADDLGETVQTLKAQGISVYAAHLKGSRAYDAFDYTKPCAFLIGNEGNGLSPELTQLADAAVRIPMEGQVESLNAAVSAALLTYECSRQRRRAYENLV